MPTDENFWNIWEPIPYNAARDIKAEQRRGFEERARKTLVWRSVRDEWPSGESLFGMQRSKFSDFDAECYCSFEGEDLVLTYGLWAWFPDPPPWGLLSRPSDQRDTSWQVWGFFGRLPRAWSVPRLGEWVRASDLQRVEMPGVDSANDT